MILSKKDIAWGYFAQFFSIASGVLILPLVLRQLTPEEIGMNYLMLTIGSLVSLFDFGFSPQFGRNFSYVFGGAQKLLKEGVVQTESENNTINYRLLATLIQTAKKVYQLLSVIVLIIMLSFGTLYIYKVTKGFSNVDNSLLAWLIYSISTFFNIYYTYYTSMLTGKGMIMEANKAMVFAKICYVAIACILLLMDFGIISVVIANLISPFVSRALAYRFFFTKDLINKLSEFKISSEEQKELFQTIWHNAKKLGLVFVGSYAINRLAMFLAGLYLPLAEIASYGIMIQLVGVISTVAGTFFNISNPQFSSLKVNGHKELLIKKFAFSMGVYYLLFISAGIALSLIGPPLLLLIKSNALLPAIPILILYLLVVMLENNHSYFATMIVIGNNVPFVSISLITGGLIALGSLLTLQYSELGILGLILVQGSVQLAYNNWKWPLVVLNEYKLGIGLYLKLCFFEVFNKVKTVCYG